MSLFNDLSYNQNIDPTCGLPFPWYTPAMIEKLKTWDIKDARVFEYGGGYSTLWWNAKTKAVYTVEHNREWIDDINAKAAQLNNFTEISAAAIGKNMDWIHAPVVAGEVELKSEYVQSIYKVNGGFDIIIIDGCYRDECIAAALTKIADGGIIICDNWMQDGIWDSIMGSRLLDGYEHEIFLDPEHKDHHGRPWKTGYWIIDKSKPHLLSVTSDYDSHRPMLWQALEHIKPWNVGEISTVLELGTGYGSTPLLRRYCEMQDRMHVAVETSLQWAEKFMPVLCVDDWYEFMEISIPSADIVFIDNAPGETRRDLIPYFADKAKIVIVHDTEPGAEKYYKMADALNQYKYRCDLIIEGAPQTTAVSNVYDFERWKGLTLGKYKFV